MFCPLPSAISRMRFPGLATGVALLLQASRVAALPLVDDFESGIFDVQSSGPATYNVSVSLAHAMHSERRVAIESSGDLVTAGNTFVNTFGDRQLEVWPRGTASVTITYDWVGTRDLTVLGTVDRLAVVLANSPVGAEVTAILTDSAGSESNVFPLARGGPSVLFFKFGQWSTADPSDAQSLAFRFEGNSSAPYLVSWIPFFRFGTLDVDFAPLFEAIAFPPLPSPPLRFNILDLVSAPLYQVDMTVQSVSAGGPVDMSAALAEIPMGGGDGGRTTFEWNPLGPPFADAQYTIAFDFSALGSLTPQVGVPTTIQDDPASFSLSFPVLLLDGASVAADCEVHLAFDVDAAQGAELALGGIARAAQRGSTGFDVTFDYYGTGGVETTEPLFHTTWTSDVRYTSVTGAPGPAAGAMNGLSLRALPSVTTGGTILQANRPIHGGARATVHDVSGRTVRTLSARPNERGILWDGRTTGGASAAAGVYFVRLQDRDGSAVTRVIRVR